MSLNMRAFDDRLSCYELSRQVMGYHVPLDNVRLELTPSRFYLLPYHHLEVAEFESAHKGDTISLSFVNHNVRITGRNLRDLAVAFQERAVVSVTPVPERYGALGECVQGLVDSIQIE
jgi:hypothetical protein